MNQSGALRHARREGRARHDAGADRADGGRGAAQPRADPAAGRPGLGLVRAGRDRRRAAGLRRLGDLGARAALRLRPRRRGGGADHRLSLRARPRHADVDHGRRRPRRAGRRADQERRGAGAHGEGRHAGRRQDRHADRGQARGDRDRAGGRASTRPSCCGSPPASSARASIRWPPRSSRRPRSAASRLAPVDGLRLADRQGRARHGRGPAASCSATRTSWPSTASTSAPLAEQADELRARRRDRDLRRASTASVAGVIAIADPVKATTPEALAGARRRRASAS